MESPVPHPHDLPWCAVLIYRLVRFTVKINRDAWWEIECQGPGLEDRSFMCWEAGCISRRVAGPRAQPLAASGLHGPPLRWDSCLGLCKPHPLGGCPAPCLQGCLVFLSLKHMQNDAVCPTVFYHHPGGWCFLCHQVLWRPG